MDNFRTGKGDGGSTYLGGKQYRKGHPLVSYGGALDTVQAHTAALPRNWGDFKPREVFQELMFALGSVIGARQPRDHEIAVQEIGIYMEGQIEHIIGGLPTLDKFLRTTEQNSELQRLRAFVREAETRCVAARDHLELEDASLSENLIYMLDACVKPLNIASSWVFSFVYAYTIDTYGQIPANAVWVRWPEDKIRMLNL
jgi:cob(I)alamin adenosyltransferase